MEVTESKIYITEPLLPDLTDLVKEFEEIWQSKWVTNMGTKHELLEQNLKKALKVQNVCLYNNGTTALLTALKALDLPYGSEVITTPFTFAATPHCVVWNGLKLVFCDIEPETMCIDADKIENLITPNTSAILGIHVYGFPCDVVKIDKIAQKHNLKVIYDAAHAFSTEINGIGIGNFGDITMFSFHATKLFNTIEGGCLTYKNNDLSKQVNYLRNFGIKDEETVECPGINGKMNELQAAIGLLNLEAYKEEQAKRARIKDSYYKNLSGINGIDIPMMPPFATDSMQYFPIIIQDNYKMTRDGLYSELKKYNINSRKYFYPLCSDYDCYKNLPSSSVNNLPIANDIKNRVLCLPFYGNLKKEIIEFICQIIR